MSTRVDTVREGSVVTFAYTLRLRDGTRAEIPGLPSPVTFVVGDGKMLQGVEGALLGLTEGDQRAITLSVQDAFGPVQRSQRIKLERARFAPERAFQLGQPLRLRHKSGDVRQGQVISVTDETIQVDFNHPLAGKVLKFYLDVLKIDTVEVAPSALPSSANEA